MKRTGVLGGTFDPIHKAHLGIAEAAMREYGLDEVWLMPAGDPYFKADKEVTPARERLYMTVLSARDEAGKFRVSDLELRLPGDTHTAETMTLLKKRFPKRAFFFIIGADSLMNLHLWYDIGTLFSCCTVLAAGRPDAAELGKMKEEIRRLTGLFPQADIRLIHNALMDVSSTEIRHLIESDGEVRAAVTPRVRAYIEARGLYRKSGNPLDR